MTYWKTTYDLSIESDLDLPELTDAEPGRDRRDVKIELGVLPDPWRWGARQIGPLIWASATALSFEVPDIGRYLISDGRRIVVEPSATSDLASVRLFLLGSALGALLLQRGAFLLHGCAVEIDDVVVAAVGPSGAGKSTLAEGMRRRGHAVLADDVVAINEDGMVMPGIARIKLWSDVMERLSIERAPLSRIRPNLEKYHVDLDAVPMKPRPVRWIYALADHHEADVTITPAIGCDAFAILRDSSYRRRFVDALGLKADHLRKAMRVAAMARLATVHRPSNGFALDALVDAILDDVRR